MKPLDLWYTEYNEEKGGDTVIANPDRYKTMRYARSGRSGLMLPAVSLGLWHNFGTDADFGNMQAICHTAFDLGVTHFDLANNYGPAPGAAEENFGKILKGGLGAYRDELVISTKAGYTMWEGPYGDFGSKKHLTASIDQSLRRMGLDYVDIFYHHRPDPDTPLEETAEALDLMVRQGKALYIGISNYKGERLREMRELLVAKKTPFVIDQVRYSMLDRTIEEDGTKRIAAELGVGLIAFSPLAQGLLTDKYLGGIPADSRIRRDGRFLKEGAVTAEYLAHANALNDLARERGQTLAQMALCFVLRDGVVASVLTGASSPSQVRENVAALDAPPFTAEELAKIDRILTT